MSSTPMAETPRSAVRSFSRLAFVAWGSAVVASYVALRGDARPIAAALWSRSLDVSVPLLAVGSCIPLARLCLSRLVPSLHPLDRALFLGPVAIGLLISLTTALGALHGLTPTTLVVVLAALGALGLRSWPAVLDELRSAARQTCTTSTCSDLSCRGPGLVLGAIAGCALIMTCTPAVSQDALHYHLAVPRAWLATATLCDVPGNIYARFPMNAETLFAVGLALRGEISAKVFHWLGFVFTSLAVWRLGARFASPRLAGWAALAFASVPTAFRVATWAYVEHFGILFLVLSWLVISSGCGRSVRGVALAGWLAGLACGVKYTFVPPAIFLGVWAIARLPAPRWQGLVAGVAAGVLGGGFWYFRNLIELGNPVFPFLYTWLGGPGWDLDRAQSFARALAEWGALDWDLPLALTYRATFASIEGFDGIVGPTFLLAVPIMGLALARNPACRPTGLFALVLGVTWLLSTHQIRFLLPALAVGSALIPAGLAMLSERARASAKMLLGAAVGASLLAPVLLFVQLSPLSYVVGAEGRDAFCDRNLPGGDYVLFRGLDRWVPADGRVLLAGGGSPTFLCSRPVYADSVVENHSLREMLVQGRTPQGVADRLRAAGFTHLLFRFPLVFGEAADLDAEEQRLLMKVLNEHAHRVVALQETMLYALDVEEQR
ncbi:MAG: hypothetical protein AB7O52_18490 [Planctomycetota bacterium]